MGALTTYPIVSRLLGWMAMLARTDTDTDTDILVLRHQLAVLRRHNPGLDRRGQTAR
jgi:hypothetical protein